MGNAVPICQQICNQNLVYSKRTIEIMSTDNSYQLTPSYIKKNYHIYKSIQNFFVRDSQIISNSQITINSRLNNLNFKTKIVNEIINKSEKEIDLNNSYSKLNSMLSVSENEKEKLKSFLKTNDQRKNDQKKKTINSRLLCLSSKNFKEKINIMKLKKEQMNTNDENPQTIIKLNNNNTNYNISHRRTSLSSIFSNIETTVISHHPKGYFLYKHINFNFLGKTDSKKNKTGFGIITYEDKSKLKGYFENDKVNGYAKFIDLKSIYVGYYKDSIPNGFGLYIKDNVKTIGDTWLKNHLNGIGFQIFGINDFYQGNFIKSVKEGLGLYHWNDNTICFGEWKDDKLNGYGIIKYSNNNIYIGEFKDNIMDGWGEFLWNDNKYYCGQYKDGSKHGFGIYVSNFKKYDVYIGFWVYGKANGIGIKINENDMFACIWKNGKKGNYVKYWEIKDYLKPNQTKFGNFLLKDIKFFKQYIKDLQDYKLFTEETKYKNLYEEFNLYLK